MEQTIFQIKDNQIINKHIDLPKFNKNLSFKQRKILNVNQLKYRSKINFLEVSTSSQLPIGKNASALNLQLTYNNINTTIENWYQAGKTFQNHGTSPDLLNVNPFSIKKSIRPLQKNDQLICFTIGKQQVALEPKDLFYNWIYCLALNQHPQLVKQLNQYNAFSDINFNHKYGIACQAKACCVYLILYRNQKTDCISDIHQFKNVVYQQLHL